MAHSLGETTQQLKMLLLFQMTRVQCQYTCSSQLSVTQVPGDLSLSSGCMCAVLMCSHMHVHIHTYMTKNKIIKITMKHRCYNLQILKGILLCRC